MNKYRHIFKGQAKIALSRNYWVPVLFFLFLLNPFNNFDRDMLSDLSTLKEFEVVIAAMIMPLNFLMPLFGLFFSIFVSDPLYVGVKRYYMLNRSEKPSMDSIFWVFSESHYTRIVAINFKMILSIMFWSLFLIIPGIIRYLQLCLVPYILAENPNMSKEDVFKLSKKMTDKNTLDILFIHLSFMGWFILCILSIGMGFILLRPYINATCAEMYAYLRTHALMNGDADKGMLPGFENEPQFFDNSQSDSNDAQVKLSQNIPPYIDDAVTDYSSSIPPYSSAQERHTQNYPPHYPHEHKMPIPTVPPQKYTPYDYTQTVIDSLPKQYTNSTESSTTNDPGLF